jgi:hypothetical protein
VSARPQVINQPNYSPSAIVPGMLISISIPPSLAPSFQFYTPMGSRLPRGPFSEPWMTRRLSLCSRRSFAHLGSCTDSDRRGYGYQVCIVEDLHNLDNELFAALQWATQEIRKIQGAARSGQPLVKPRWPVIILRTPKVKPLTIVLCLTDTSN